MNSIIPSTYAVEVRLAPESLIGLGLVIYLSLIGWRLFR